MKPPKCRNCGVVEWRHICASNSASNAEKPSGSELTAEAVVKAAKQIAGFKQRWDREKYNAYQRGLMRARRAAGRVSA